MKRVNPVSLNPHQVTRHYTYLKWSNCEKCKQDFRRENGVSWMWFGTKQMYFCVDCSHNANIAWVNEYISWLYEMHHYKPPTGR